MSETTNYWACGKCGKKIDKPHDTLDDCIDDLIQVLGDIHIDEEATFQQEMDRLTALMNLYPKSKKRKKIVDNRPEGEEDE